MGDVTKVFDAAREEDNLVGDYSYLTCHQKCQEDYECETFSFNSVDFTCKLYNYGACTRSVAPVTDTTLYARSAFREIPLTIPNKCTHFSLYNEDAPKVTACKEITDLRTCRLQGVYYVNIFVDSICGGITYDMLYRQKEIDLSASAYNAENCEAECTLLEPGDCTYFAFTDTTCTLYPGECTIDQGDAEFGWQVYKRMQSCYWTDPLLIHEDSACDN